VASDDDQLSESQGASIKTPVPGAMLDGGHESRNSHQFHLNPGLRALFRPQAQQTQFSTLKEKTRPFSAARLERVVNVVGHDGGQRSRTLPCSSRVVLEAHEVLDEAGCHRIGGGPRRSVFCSGYLVQQAGDGVVLGFSVGEFMSD